MQKNYPFHESAGNSLQIFLSLFLLPIFLCKKKAKRVIKRRSYRQEGKKVIKTSLLNVMQFSSTHLSTWLFAGGWKKYYENEELFMPSLWGTTILPPPAHHKELKFFFSQFSSLSQINKICENVRDTSTEKFDMTFRRIARFTQKMQNKYIRLFINFS